MAMDFSDPQGDVPNKLHKRESMKVITRRRRGIMNEEEKRQNRHGTDETENERRIKMLWVEFKLRIVRKKKDRKKKRTNLVKEGNRGVEHGKERDEMR
jgi:hypothetical protein